MAAKAAKSAWRRCEADRLAAKAIEGGRRKSGRRSALGDENAAAKMAAKRNWRRWKISVGVGHRGGGQRRQNRKWRKALSGISKAKHSIKPLSRA